MNKEAFDALKRIRQETCPATINPDFDKEKLRDGRNVAKMLLLN